jgi:hypothetical protein
VGDEAQGFPSVGVLDEIVEEPVVALTGRAAEDCELVQLQAWEELEEHRRGRPPKALVGHAEIEAATADSHMAYPREGILRNRVELVEHCFRALEVKQDLTQPLVADLQPRSTTRAKQSEAVRRRLDLDSPKQTHLPLAGRESRGREEFRVDEIPDFLRQSLKEQAPQLRIDFGDLFRSICIHLPGLSLALVVLVVHHGDSSVVVVRENCRLNSGRRVRRDGERMKENERRESEQDTQERFGQLYLTRSSRHQRRGS